MNKDWPTKHQDLRIAEIIMEKHASLQGSPYLSLFELVFSQEEKRMKFRMADWVCVLAAHYHGLYGPTEGEWVTRRVISNYMVQNETLH